MNTSVLGRSAEFFKHHGAENTVREILHQPRLWNELGDYLTVNREKIAKFMEQVMAVPNIRIVFTGAGSSAFIGESLQYLFASEQSIRCETVHTTDIVSMPDSVLFDVPTLLISYSRSGESPESVGALKYAQKKISKLFNIVIVCKKNSSLANYAEGFDGTLVLDMPPESSDVGFAMTSSVSCMALATWCLFGYKNMDKFIEYMRELAKSVDGDFAEMDTIAKKVAALDYERAVFLGSGKLSGLAHESAIKSLELTNGHISATYDTATGFRHGPKTIVHPNTLTVHYISPEVFTGKYDLDLLNEIINEKHGNKVVAIMAKGDQKLPDGCEAAFLYEIPAPKENMGICSYIKGLMFSQILAVEKSLACGNKVDSPCSGGEVNRVVKGVIIYELQ